MSYRLNKPLSLQQRADFIVKYNHNKGLRIEETNKALYALEAWELLEDDTVIDNTESYEEEQALQEKERIARLCLTAADVERGIYKAKGIDFEDILELVVSSSLSEVDIKALKIELKANHFYRGNLYVNIIGELLGLTSQQLDKFFEENDYKYLVKEEV